MQGTGVDPRKPERATPHRLQTWFAGVALELTGDAPLGPWGRDPHAAPRGDEPVLARLCCHVEDVPLGDVERADDRSLSWRWDSDVARTGALGLRATVRRIGPGHYEAHVQRPTAPTRRALREVVSVAAFPVLEREGGLVMHAAGVELQGQAVLFVGPSGAGKSTAAGLCEGAPHFTTDRAAIFEADGRWWAAALPGGSPAEVSLRSGHRCLPLAGVFRVASWGEPGTQPTAERLPVPRAVAVLRESVLRPSCARLAGLEGLVELSRGVVVGQLQTVLGQAVGAALRRGLAARVE